MDKINEYIKTKRKQLGLTSKEFIDSLSLGKDGHWLLKKWESGEIIPSNEMIEKIKNFAQVTPFPNPKPKDSRFTFIDLFAGIGGIRLGFQKHGGRCVFSSEWNKFSQKTYKINFGDTPEGDITLDEVKAKIKPHNILLAGFPCQPFSLAGLKKGFEDTRGTLFFEIEEIIKKHQPEAFLLENVKNLKSHDKGNTFKVIKNILENKLGYEVYSTVLSAKDYGVPQNRERIYIVGFHKGKVGKNLNFKFPDPILKQICVGNILEDNVNEKHTISDKIYQGHIQRKEMHRKKGNGFGFSIFKPSDPYTNTISARYYKDGSEILIDQGENKNPRMLTRREAAQLQGFPEEFIIPVSDSQAYKQFGNSVSVPVIEAIAGNMINILENKNIIPKKVITNINKEITTEDSCQD